MLQKVCAPACGGSCTAPALLFLLLVFILLRSHCWREIAPHSWQCSCQLTLMLVLCRNHLSRGRSHPTEGDFWPDQKSHCCITIHMCMSEDLSMLRIQTRLLSATAEGLLKPSEELMEIRSLWQPKQNKNKAKKSVMMLPLAIFSVHEDSRANQDDSFTKIIWNCPKHKIQPISL